MITDKQFVKTLDNILKQFVDAVNIQFRKEEKLSTKKLKTTSCMNERQIKKYNRIQKDLQELTSEIEANLLLESYISKLEKS